MSWESLADPVFHSRVSVEFVSVATEEGRIVSSDLLPGTMEVVGHEVQVVKMLRQHWNIIAGINDFGTGRDCCCYKQVVRLE